MVPANEFLENALNAMATRAQERDIEQERSMDKIVNVFNALTGHTLT